MFKLKLVFVVLFVLIQGACSPKRPVCAANIRTTKLDDKSNEVILRILDYQVEALTEGDCQSGIRELGQSFCDEAKKAGETTAKLTLSMMWSDGEKVTKQNPLYSDLCSEFK